jgi:uncharacterized membrane protein
VQPSSAINIRTSRIEPAMTIVPGGGVLVLVAFAWLVAKYAAARARTHKLPLFGDRWLMPAFRNVPIADVIR